MALFDSQKVIHFFLLVNTYFRPMEPPEAQGASPGLEGFLGEANHKKYAPRPQLGVYFSKIDALTVGGSTNLKVRQTLQNTGCQKTALLAPGEKHTFSKIMLSLLVPALVVN